MVLIVNNKIVGSGFSEGWLENELNIILGDCGGFICEDGKKIEIDMGYGEVVDLFMCSEDIVRMLLEGEVINIFDSKDNILYIGVSNIDLNDEL